MFRIENAKLVGLIRSSETLKEKLNEEQLEKFILKAEALSPEGQEELITKLEQEAVDFKKDQEALLATAREIDKFDQDLQKDLKAFERQTMKNAEVSSTEEEDKQGEDLISQLDEI